MEERISKENYYLDIAESVLERSTCIRKKYGADHLVAQQNES